MIREDAVKVIILVKVFVKKSNRLSNSSMEASCDNPHHSSLFSNLVLIDKR